MGWPYNVEGREGKGDAYTQLTGIDCVETEDENATEKQAVDTPMGAVGAVYFIIFNIIVALIMLNLFVGIVCSNISQV